MLNPKNYDIFPLNINFWNKLWLKLDYNCRIINLNYFSLTGSFKLTQKSRVVVKPEEGPRRGVGFSAYHEPEDSSVVEVVQLLQEAECKC
jgi:hypothetical protein